MAEETESALGTTASCAGGPGGKVSRVIIDPATETVTHLVIEPKHRLGRGRLVPLDLVDTRNTNAGSTYKNTEASPKTASAGADPR